MKKEKSFFSKQLKKLMIEKNLTQEELGKKIKVNRQMISRWVSGGRNPSLNSLNKFAKVFEVPVNYFIEEKNEIVDCDKNDKLDLILNFIEKQTKIIENIDKNFENYVKNLKK